MHPYSGAPMHLCSGVDNVADARIFDVKGLYPVLQSGSELAGCAAELFQQEGAEACVGLTDLDGLNKLFPM